MSQFYVSGPTFHFVGDGNGNFSHVGFCQRSTPVQLMGMNSDVNADYAGPAMPADVQQLGEMAMFMPAFSRYNQLVINTLAARRRGGTAGTGGAGAIGSLLVAEGLTFPYLIVAGYRNKAVFSAGSMNAGYFFPQCYVADAIDFELSTEITVPRLIIRAIPTFDQPDGRYSAYQIGIPSGVTLPAVG